MILGADYRDRLVDRIVIAATRYVVTDNFQDFADSEVFEAQQAMDFLPEGWLGTQPSRQLFAAKFLSRKIMQETLHNATQVSFDRTLARVLPDAVPVVLLEPLEHEVDRLEHEVLIAKTPTRQDVHQIPVRKNLFIRLAARDRS